jgi:hypothetical protein
MEPLRQAAFDTLHRSHATALSLQLLQRAQTQAHRQGFLTKHCARPMRRATSWTLRPRHRLMPYLGSPAARRDRFGSSWPKRLERAQGRPKSLEVPSQRPSFCGGYLPHKERRFVTLAAQFHGRGFVKCSDSTNGSTALVQTHSASLYNRCGSGDIRRIELDRLHFDRAVEQADLNPPRLSVCRRTAKRRERRPSRRSPRPSRNRVVRQHIVR